MDTTQETGWSAEEVFCLAGIKNADLQWPAMDYLRWINLQYSASIHVTICICKVAGMRHAHTFKIQTIQAVWILFCLFNDFVLSSTVPPGEVYFGVGETPTFIH
jgi:hypothetical protein